MTERAPAFGLVLSNPPYVPAATAALHRHRKTRCWDAGPDGRALLARICADVPDVLAPDGVVLLVHSTVCDTACTLEAVDRRPHRAGAGADHRALRPGDVVARGDAGVARIRGARTAQRGAGGRGGTEGDD